MRKIVEEYGGLSADAQGLSEMLELADEEERAMLEEEQAGLQKRVDDLYRETLFTMKHADTPAIVRVKGGAGGTEAQDWASMLLRQYLKYAERKGFNRQHDDYLRTAAEVLMPQGAAVLYIARLEGEPIGASLVYDSDDTRTYAHASMDVEHRKLSAGIPLVVRMILDAKEKGLSTFDLFGTAPDDEADLDEIFPTVPRVALF